MLLGFNGFSFFMRSLKATLTVFFFMVKKKGGRWGDGEEVSQISRPKKYTLGNYFQSRNTKVNRNSKCEKILYFHILFPKYSR